MKHLNIPGTVYFDSQLDYLSEYYNDDTKNRAYFVALDEENQVIGGVGLAEFEGFSDCAEIQKLYISLYEKLGFCQIERPKSVVHGTMDHFYLKKL